MTTAMNNPLGAPPRLVDIKTTHSQILGCSRTNLFELVRSGDFPKPISISPGGKRKAFILEEVEAWIAARAAERDMAEAA